MHIDVFMKINKKLKGSITVEAAFSFTLTVFILFLMVGPLLIIKTSSDIIVELNKESKLRCQYEMVKYFSKDTYIYTKIKEKIDDNAFLSENIDEIENIVNNIGIMYKTYTRYDDNESEYRNINYVYDLNPDIYDNEKNIVNYDYNFEFLLPYNLLHVRNVNKRLVNYRRAFVGADGNRFDSLYEDGDFIYVANNVVNSSVYHTNINCTYLKKNTEGHKYEDIGFYRNYSNKKYTKCDYCFRGIAMKKDIICYITRYGDKYHYKNDCPLMTAYVTKIPKENIELYNLKPCFRCGFLKDGE